MKKFISVGLVALFLHPLIAGEFKKKDHQKEWILLRYEQLSKAVPQEVPQIKLEEFGGPGAYSYHPETHGGIIYFSETEWIMITQSSSHYEKSGDITMIRTSANEYYLNYGHCCKTLIIESKNKIETLEDFLASTGKAGGNIATPWIKYESEPVGTGQPM